MAGKRPLSPRQDRRHPRRRHQRVRRTHGRFRPGAVRDSRGLRGQRRRDPSRRSRRQTGGSAMSASPDPEPQFSPGQPVWLRGSGRRGTVESGASTDTRSSTTSSLEAISRRRTRSGTSQPKTTTTRCSAAAPWDLLDSDRVPSGADDAQAAATSRAEPLLVPGFPNRPTAVSVQARPQAAPIPLRSNVHRRRGRAGKDDRGRHRHAGTGARVGLRRVLVVCPPALSRKWRAEMPERFDLEFEILDAPVRREIVADPDLSHAPVRAIASLGLLRAPTSSSPSQRVKRASTSSSSTSRTHAEPRDRVSPTGRAALRPSPITC